MLNSFSNGHVLHDAVDARGADVSIDLDPHEAALAPAFAPRVLNGPVGGRAASCGLLRRASLLSLAAFSHPAPPVLLRIREVGVIASLFPASARRRFAFQITDFVGRSRTAGCRRVLGEHDGMVQALTAAHVACDNTS